MASRKPPGGRRRMLQRLDIGRGDQRVVAADRQEEHHLRREAREPADVDRHPRIERHHEHVLGHPEDVLLREDHDLGPDPERRQHRLDRVAHVPAADDRQPGDRPPLAQRRRQGPPAHQRVGDEVDPRARRGRRGPPPASPAGGWWRSCAPRCGCATAGRGATLPRPLSPACFDVSRLTSPPVARTCSNRAQSTARALYVRNRGGVTRKMRRRGLLVKARAREDPRRRRQRRVRRGLSGRELPGFEGHQHVGEDPGDALEVGRVEGAEPPALGLVEGLEAGPAGLDDARRSPAPAPAAPRRRARRAGPRPPRSPPPRASASGPGRGASAAARAGGRRAPP